MKLMLPVWSYAMLVQYAFDRAESGRMLRSRRVNEQRRGRSRTLVHAARNWLRRNSACKFGRRDRCIQRENPTGLFDHKEIILDMAVFLSRTPILPTPEARGLNQSPDGGMIFSLIRGPVNPAAWNIDDSEGVVCEDRFDVEIDCHEILRFHGARLPYRAFVPPSHQESTADSCCCNQANAWLRLHSCLHACCRVIIATQCATTGRA